MNSLPENQQERTRLWPYNVLGLFFGLSSFKGSPDLPPISRKQPKLEENFKHIPEINSLTTRGKTGLLLSLLSSLDTPQILALRLEDIAGRIIDYVMLWTYFDSLGLKFHVWRNFTPKHFPISFSFFFLQMPVSPPPFVTTSAPPPHSMIKKIALPRYELWSPGWECYNHFIIDRVIEGIVCTHLLYVYPIFKTQHPTGCKDQHIKTKYEAAPIKQLCIRVVFFWTQITLTCPRSSPWASSASAAPTARRESPPPPHGPRP